MQEEIVKKDIKFSRKALHRVTIAELPPKIGRIEKNYKDDKFQVITDWLINWIEEGFESGKIKDNFKMPKKETLAYYLGVCPSIIQSVYEMLEGKGYLIAQKGIGAVIKRPNEIPVKMRKSTFKREEILYRIKKYLSDSRYKKGDTIPTIREFGRLFNCSATITKPLLEILRSQNILYLEHECGCALRYKMNVDNYHFEGEEVKHQYLGLKTYNRIIEYIQDNLKVGDKIPSNNSLMNIFNVSLKTVNDATRKLIDEGILYPRRGPYGTVVTKMPGENSANTERKENKIFNPVTDLGPYKYQIAYNRMVEYIRENISIGEKIPSSNILSAELNLCKSNVVKAMNSLIKEGYLCSSSDKILRRPIVVRMPMLPEESFKWLAVNPEFVGNIVAESN